MYYKNFDNNITAKYGVVIIGWPFKKFQNPSEMASKTELQVLKNSLESGATYFKKLTMSELAEWEEARFERQLDEGPTDSLDTQRSANPIGDPIGDETGPDINQPTAGDQSQVTNPISDSSSQQDPVAPEGASERPQPDDPLPPAKRTRTDRFINLGVTGVDGTAVIIHKKPRKARSDKGKKRGAQR
jgi:hypothetical protein